MQFQEAHGWNLLKVLFRFLISPFLIRNNIFIAAQSQMQYLATLIPGLINVTAVTQNNDTKYKSIIQNKSRFLTNLQLLPSPNPRTSFFWPAELTSSSLWRGMGKLVCKLSPTSPTLKVMQISLTACLQHSQAKENDLHQPKSNSG